MEELWKDSNIFYNILCFLITENEKLFDRSDAVLYWRTVFHLLCILHHVYVGVLANGLDIKYNANPDIRVLYKYGPAYLTGWNFSFQMIFLGLSLLHDSLEWVDKHGSELGRKIKYWRDVLFCSIVLPYTLFVSGMFWGVYAIDRELVFPEVYDQVVPWWFNHCVHTNITVVVVVETLLQSRRHPTDKKMELILYWAVAFLYAAVYYTIYFITERWLYQVFGVMTWWQVCLYQLFIWGITYVFYLLQFPVNRFVHGPEMEADSQNIEERETIDVANGKTSEKQQEIELNHKENGKDVKELKVEPFTANSWTLKFRSLKINENSRL